MPLRHLTLKEPQYVPQYNTLDPNLVAGVAGTIQQQSERAIQEDRTAFGILKENTLSASQTLPEEFQNEMMNMFDNSRSKIDKSVEEKGPRAARSLVQREAQDLQQKMAPYQSVAQQAQQYQQKIDEVGAENNVDPHVRRWAKQNIQFGKDEGGKPVFGGIPLEIFDNWKDLGEETQKFLKQAESDIRSGTLTPAMNFENDYIERAVREVLNEDKLRSAAVANLLADSSAVEQIRYDLLARGDDPDEEIPVEIREKIVDKETGEVLQEAEVQNVSKIVQRAISIVNPSAHIKSFTKDKFTDTKQNLESKRILDDRMPSLSQSMRLGIPEGNLKRPTDLFETYSSKEETLDQLNTRIEQTENPYERSRLIDKKKQISGEIDNLITLQTRSLEEAGINLSSLTEEGKENLETAKAQAQTILNNLEGQQKDIPATYLAEARHRLNVIEQLEVDPNKILNEEDLTVLSRIVGREKINKYKEILAARNSAFSENVTVSSFNSKNLTERVTNHGQMMFNAGAQGDAALDFKRVHSNPDKARSIFETGFNKDISTIESAGFMVDPQTSELNIVYKAYDNNGEPIGLVRSKAPQQVIEYLPENERYVLESYQSSAIDIAIHSPGREAKFDVPVLTNSGVVQKGVKVRSMLAQTENGNVSTKDTAGAHFMLIFKDASGKEHNIPAESKGKLMEYLHYLRNDNVGEIMKDFNL